MAVYNAWLRPRRVLHHGRQPHGRETPASGGSHHPCREDPGSLIRDFTKWTTIRSPLQHFAESAVRAYKIAMTPPHEPVLLAVEEKLQEDAIEKGPRPLVIPKLTVVAAPGGDPNAVREAAKLLAMAEQSGDRGGPGGAAPPPAFKRWSNWPRPERTGHRSARPHEHANNHPLCNIGAGNLNRPVGLHPRPRTHRFLGHRQPAWTTARLPTTAQDQAGDQADQHRRGRSLHPRNYQDFERYQPVDIAIGADAETTLPMLTEYVKQAIPPTAAP